MKLSLILLAILALFLPNNADAFARGTATTRTQPLSASSTQLYAAKKKVAKKKKAASKKSTAALEIEALKKPELVAQIADRLDITKVAADAALTAVVDTIADNIIDRKKVSLPGFGTFQLKARAARKGRNPQTGEELDIAASLSPGFTAAKGLKERANE
ncbi:MAG: hypothetical protein SGBAC_009695 [Bacillariaceae sp.]